jgi:hypothetical protein
MAQVQEMGTNTDDANATNQRTPVAFTPPAHQGQQLSLKYQPRTPHIQGYQYETYCVNKAMFRPPTDGRRRTGRYRRPVPDPAKNVTRSPNAYDASIVCDACGLRGHPAARCFTLASAVFVDKYIAKEGNAETVQRAVDFWVARNAPMIRDNQTNEPSKANPLQVMHAYASRQDMSVDDIMDEIDWQYFDQDSTVQEVFGIMGGSQDGSATDNE